LAAELVTQIGSTTSSSTQQPHDMSPSICGDAHLVATSAPLADTSSIAKYAMSITESTSPVIEQTLVMAEQTFSVEEHISSAAIHTSLVVEPTSSTAEHASLIAECIQRDAMLLRDKCARDIEDTEIAASKAVDSSTAAMTAWNSKMQNLGQANGEGMPLTNSDIKSTMASISKTAAAVNRLTHTGHRLGEILTRHVAAKSHYDALVMAMETVLKHAAQEDDDNKSPQSLISAQLELE
jgi:hypothetical protein